MSAYPIEGGRSMPVLDPGARNAPHGDPLCPIGAHWAAETMGGTCPDCRHYRSDCVCWYIAELARGERDESVA